MKSSTKLLAFAGLLYGGAWLYTSTKKVGRSLELLRFGNPQVHSLSYSGRTVTFELSIPVDNPIDQAYSGKLLSVRLYSGTDLLAYSDPGVIEFSLAAASRSTLGPIPMSVPVSEITTLIEGGDDISYQADVELSGVRMTFRGTVNLS